MKLKRILFSLILSTLLILQSITVFAEEASGQDKAAEEAAKAEEKEKEESYARKIDTNEVKEWPEGPQVYADSAIVMDMDSGAVLYAKQADKKHYPASITKLLTTLVALENAQLTDKVLFTEDSVSFLEYDDAQIGMKPGEELSLKDSLYGVLLASANEVSHAVAESVGKNSLGGGYDTFIQKMNTRAEELGCTNSHWVNANGLHDEEHYTTAHDMALIASAVYQFEDFRKITGTLEYKIGHTNLTKEDRVFQQNHKMLWKENQYYYPYCTGGKTGYTDQAKTTLVTMADNGKMRLAAVVLYDYGVNAYTDTKAMFDYAFENFETVPVNTLQASEDISLFDKEDAQVVLPKGAEASEIEQELVLTNDGIRSGKVVYSYQGQNVGNTPVTLTEDGYRKLTGQDTAKSESRNIENQETTPEKEEAQVEQENKETMKLLIGISATVIFVVIVVVALIDAKGHRKRRHRK